MSKKKPETALTNDPQIDEHSLFVHVAEIIETRKTRAGAYANREVTLMYWEIGRYVNSVILDSKRAEYGKKIFSALSRKLTERYGKSFQAENLYRMTQLTRQFPDIEIVATLSQELSWSHFCELIRRKPRKHGYITQRTPQRGGLVSVNYAAKSPTRLMNGRKSPTQH